MLTKEQQELKDFFEKLSEWLKTNHPDSVPPVLRHATTDPNEYPKPRHTADKFYIDLDD